MRQLPFLLTSLRLALAPVVLALALLAPHRGAFAAIIIVGVLSDIFDGVIARRLGVATPRLRTYDSAVDVVFFLSVAGAAALLYPQAFLQHGPLLVTFLVSEALCNVVSLLRFRALPATHSYAAKAFGLVLCVCFVCVLGAGITDVVLPLTFVVGSAVNAEILAILLCARQRPVDVPSWFHLRR